MEFARWVEERTEQLGRRWLKEVASRYDPWDQDQAALVTRFFEVLLEMLPDTLGPYREQVDPIWLQVSELYGSVAAQRGLAAGEVIEEFQILREGLIRLLYSEPPLAGASPMALRDILRLNRVVDRGVTQASVGHTDALFFALFKGSGVPDHLAADVLTEVHDQLDALHDEYRQVMRSLSPVSGRGGG